MHEIIDETDFFQIGQQDSSEYYKIEFGESLPSNFATWPEKDKNGVFKFDSFYIQFSPTLKTYER